MLGSDRLEKAQLIYKANNAIEVLSQNITDIGIVNRGLLNTVAFCFADGNLGDAIKEHLLSLIELNTAFSNLLSMDVQDNWTLINILESYITNSDDDILSGSEILQQYDYYQDLIVQTQAGIDAIDAYYNSLSAGGQFWDYLSYRIARNNLVAERNQYRNQRLIWLNKMNLLDSVKTATSELFLSNAELRQIVQEGYNEIGSEWDGDTCNPDYTASWRVNLERVSNEVIARYSASYYSIDENGNVTIYWDEVDSVLAMDPNLVNTYQVAAISGMFPYLSDEQLGEVFSHGDLDPDGSDMSDQHYISPVLGLAINYYFSSVTQDLEPAEFENNNDVLRATALRTTYNYVAVEDNLDGCDYTVTFTSELEREGSTVIHEYDVHIDCELPETTQLEGVGSISTSVANSSRNVDLIVMRNASGDTWDQVAGSVVVYYVGPDAECGNGLAPGTRRDIGETIVDITMEASNIEIPGLSLLLLPANVLYDEAEQHDSASNASACIDVSTLSRAFQAVSANGNMIITDHSMWSLDEADSVNVINVHIDEEALSARISDYNDENPDSQITLREVEDGFYRLIHGYLDPTLLQIGAEESDEPFVQFYWWVYS